METVKRSEVARGWEDGMGRDEKAEHKGILEQ